MFITTRRIWKCRGCRKTFSAKAGTIFEDSPIPLDKWLTAMWMVANCKNGVSSYEIHRDLGVTQKSAWFMLHRIRLVLQTKTYTKFAGDIEVDETFIGGKARNMHRKQREAKIKGTGGSGKAVVMGILERNGSVRAMVVPSRRKGQLQSAVKEFVESGANVYTDALKSYEGLEADYAHQVIDHAEAYVQGQVHTNGLENFWSLLKRSLHGTYVSVEPFHLFRYLDEQMFRFNNRKATDWERFVAACREIVGRRLTYSQVTGGW